MRQITGIVWFFQKPTKLVICAKKLEERIELSLKTTTPAHRNNY